MDWTESENTDSATQAWVLDALEHALRHDQTRLVPYLIELSEELVFESEIAVRRTSLLSRSVRRTA